MSKTRLFLLAPTIVFQAQVDQTTFVFPLGQATFDNVVVGSHNAVTAERLVVFGTTQGADDLGRQRIRKTATSDTIYFGRSSPGTRDGEVYPIDDCWITVYDIRLPFAKIPNITNNGLIFKDHDIEWDGQTGDDSPPKARAGADVAGTIDSATSKLRVQLPGVANTSYATADGASIASYSWSLPTGVALVSGYALTDAVIQVDCDPGFYQVRLEITDSNGNSHAAWVKIYARNPANDTTVGNFQIERRSHAKDGQTLALRILEDIPAGTYIDGTVVMLWEGEPASVTDRSHMRFTGWHHTDPATIQGGRTGILRDTTLECLDIAGKLRTLPGFPLTVENKDTPSSWLHMKTANMDKYIDYILRWHSNAFELADFLPSGTGADYPFVILGSDAQSLWDQAARRANALVPDYHLVCNVRGQLSVKVDLMLQETADRTSTVQATLTEVAWSDIRYTHQRAPRVHWLRSEAILASATQIAAIFTVAPDTTPGQGSIEQTHGEQLAKSHVDLMAAEGHRYARLNARESHFTITLAEGDEQGIEPAALTWVKLTISTATAAQRGLTFTEARGLVHQVDVRYQHERTGTIKTVTLTWERETVGTPAAPHVPPDTDFPDDWEPEPDGGFEPDPAPTGSGDGFGDAGILLTSTIARTTDLSAISPTYTDITGTVGGTVYDLIRDPWNPKTKAFAISSTGVWRTADYNNASPTWTQVLSSSGLPSGTGTKTFWYKIIGSINIENWFACMVRSNTTTENRTYLAKTADAGANWTFHQISHANVNTLVNGGLDIVPRVVSSNYRLYAGMYHQTGPTNTYAIYRSDDVGATWSQTTTLTYSAAPEGPHCLMCPYEGNTAGNIVWVSFTADSGVKGLYKSIDSGANFTQVTLPGLAANDHGSRVKRLGIEVYAQNSNQVAIWTTANKLFKSTDGGSTFTEITYSGYVPATHGSVMGAGGFPYVSGQYYIVTSSRYVFVSIDGGITWTDKTGNLQSIILSNASTTNTRNGVIVPDWTA